MGGTVCGFSTRTHIFIIPFAYAMILYCRPIMWSVLDPAAYSAGRWRQILLGLATSKHNYVSPRVAFGGT
jgi:hypothetical protein